MSTRMTWIDITRPIDETLVTWRGRARPEQSWEKQIAAGDHCNASRWELSAHSGTHMDAPLHFVAGGQSIDQIPPEVFIGPCRLVDLGPAAEAILDEETARQVAGTQRLLIRTAHSHHPPDGVYREHEALLSEEAARLLLASGLQLIGTDRLSVDDSRGERFALHHLLLGAGCAIIEGLWLPHVTPGNFTLYAAPLRVIGGEASPVRAFLEVGRASPACG